MRPFLNRAKSFCLSRKGLLISGLIALSVMVLGCPNPTNPGGSDLEGHWTLAFHVELSATDAGNCLIHAPDLIPDTVQIHQKGDTLTVTGLGDSTNTLHWLVGASNGGGSIAEVKMSGAYVRYLGLSTIDSANSNLSVDAGNSTMSGEEIWSWARGTSTCHGTSSVTAVKISAL